jgi:phosphoglucomutase
LQEIRSWRDRPLTIPTRPFPDQRPGTSGLRKKVSVFRQANYAENFLQSIFDVVRPAPNATLVIGGDGRFHNRAVIQQAIRIAAANGYRKAIVGRGGILSTPAASHIIRKYGASGGLLFTASHNPGGPNGDFGIKYNGANGGPAPEHLTESIYGRTQLIDRWLTVDEPDVNLDRRGRQRSGSMWVEVIDPVADYVALMEKIFDFDLIRDAVARGLTVAFDAMNAVTGPYASEIFERSLGLAQGTVRNRIPLEDFGGRHPDPNPVNARELFDLLMGPAAPDLGAASDGDGDRNLIIGRGRFITPSDSLAMLAANAHFAPAYRAGLKGVARSMPTSGALDRVADGIGIAHYETPTGWKYFGNLFDAGLISICGEESAGTGSDHIREKDGIWAVLLWLNILAERRMSVDQLAREHWRRFGRNYYARLDYEGVDMARCSALMDDLTHRLADLRGQRLGSLTVANADQFAYADPVDGSVSAAQGIRIFFERDSRIVLRLSGTGTEGSTLRVYTEHFEGPSGRLDADPALILAELASAAAEIALIERHIGRAAPDVIT